MARRRILIACVALSLASCAHVHRVSPGTPGVGLQEVNRRLAGRMVLVKLTDGTEFGASDVSVSPDSLYMRPRQVPIAHSSGWTRVARAIPIREVDAIEVTRRSRGALDGALLGLTLGGAAGAALGPLILDSSVAAEEAALGGIILGGLGVSVGSLLGFGTGSTDVYDLSAMSGDAEPVSDE